MIRYALTTCAAFCPVACVPQVQAQATSSQIAAEEAVRRQR
jgi:hypothetical protein